MAKKAVLIFLLFFATVSLDATCKDELLSLTLPDNSTLKQALNTLAKECRYTIIYSDKKTREIVTQKVLSPVEVYRKGIEHIFDVLISRNNLHYKLENDILTVSHVMTKSFKVDYIDSTRTGNSNTDVIISGSTFNGSQGSGTGSSYSTSYSSSGASGSSTTGINNGTSGATGAYIKTTESFDFWQDLESNLQSIIDRPEDGDEKYNASIIINKKSGLVIASGTKKQLDRVENYLNQVLDSLRKQVIIDVQIIGVTLDDSHTLGIDWSRFSLDFDIMGTLTNNKEDTTVNGTRTFSETESIVVDRSAGLQMSGFFNFLRQFGETKSLSNPKVLAINNQPSMISVGDNINYLIKESYSTGTTTTTVTESQIPASLFVGVLLDITPQIDEAGFITLRINPSISEFKYSEDSVKQSEARNLPPDTVTRRISSVVRVKDGDSIILGGLISSTKGEVENKVRLLGDIPYLGRLFKSTATTDITTEIIFVLTPHLAQAGSMPTLTDLGFAHMGELALAKTESKATDVNLTVAKTTEPKEDEEIDTIPYVKSEP